MAEPTADEASDEPNDGGSGGTMNTAVLCADDPVRPTVDELVATLAELNEVSDLFAELNVANTGTCVGWPASIDPVLPIATSAAPASLVIGGRTDAATPIEFAPIMADAIGGVFLSSDHDGHTAVFKAGESRCLDDVAFAFMLDGTLPPAGTNCPGGAPVGTRDGLAGARVAGACRRLERRPAVRKRPEPSSGARLRVHHRRGTRPRSAHSCRRKMTMSLRPFAAARLLPILACAFLVACSDDDNERGPTGEQPMEGGVSSLSIAPCEDDPMLDCGTLDVPLIHDSTDQRRMLVDVVVLPGTGAGPHEPLLVNPGGPGQSGTGAVRFYAAMDALPAALRERYDFVGFDPRGLGASQSVDCSNLVPDDSSDSPFLQDRAELEAYAFGLTAFADACFAEYGDVLQHLGSNAVVRDMEALRELLDAPKMHFLGYSYGTRLAALYLERYPDTSGRMVLDGVVLPNGELAPLFASRNLAKQRNLDALLTACGTTLPDCDPIELDAVFATRLQQGIEMENELVAGVLFTLLNALVNNPGAGAVAIPTLIDYALTGDSGPAVAFARENGIVPDETADETADETSDDDGTGETINIAVYCADDPTRPTVDELTTALPGLNEASDLFAEGNIASLASCVGWPASIDPVLPITTSAAPASLVIGGRTDAATPFELAPVMADAIGGVFLASDHDGHTSVFNRQSRCVDDIALAFLLDGTLPPAGTSCPADAGEEQER